MIYFCPLYYWRHLISDPPSEKAKFLQTGQHAGSQSTARLKLTRCSAVCCAGMGLSLAQLCTAAVMWLPLPLIADKTPDYFQQ